MSFGFSQCVIFLLCVDFNWCGKFLPIWNHLVFAFSFLSVLIIYSFSKTQRNNYHMTERTHVPRWHDHRERKVVLSEQRICLNHLLCSEQYLKPQDLYLLSTEYLKFKLVQSGCSHNMSRTPTLPPFVRNFQTLFVSIFLRFLDPTSPLSKQNPIMRGTVVIL